LEVLAEGEEVSHKLTASIFRLQCKVLFVGLSVLIVKHVPFCVFCLIVLFCVLFVCECVLDYCHRDGGALFDYVEVFLCVFLCSKVNARAYLAKTGHGPHFQFFILFIIMLLCMFRSLYSVYCLCVDAYCTTSTGCQPNVCCTDATGCHQMCAVLLPPSVNHTEFKNKQE
jgi:hypothetical protein